MCCWSFPQHNSSKILSSGNQTWQLNSPLGSMIFPFFPYIYLSIYLFIYLSIYQSIKCPSLWDVPGHVWWHWKFRNVFFRTYEKPWIAIMNRHSSSLLTTNNHLLIPICKYTHIYICALLGCPLLTQLLHNYINHIVVHHHLAASCPTVAIRRHLATGGP